VFLDKTFLDLYAAASLQVAPPPPNRDHHEPGGRPSGRHIEASSCQPLMSLADDGKPRMAPFLFADDVQDNDRVLLAALPAGNIKFSACWRSSPPAPNDAAIEPTIWAGRGAGYPQKRTAVQLVWARTGEGQPLLSFTAACNWAP